MDKVRDQTVSKTRNEPYVVGYVKYDDIETVKKRIPEELRTRLRDVFIRRSRAVRYLGSVRRKGRRDIARPETATKK